MSEPPLLGAKIRTLRRKENLTQAKLASMLGVSPSYLNLIENNRRPLTAPVLIKLAQVFQLDLSQFGGTEDARLVADLREVFGDPMFDPHGITNADVRELAAASPAIARGVLALYRGYRTARESAETLGERLSAEGIASGDPARLPSEEVTDLIQRHMNHFGEIEEAAEDLWGTASLDASDVYGGLVAYLEGAHGIGVRLVRAEEERRAMRRYDPARRRIDLSELLPPRSRRFQLAHQVGLITQSALFDRLADDPELAAPDARALARVAFANYFAAAVLMPYASFLEACRAERYDVEILAHRFGTSFEQTCHRMTTLRRPGAEGVPLHFIRMDVAGNISKRFSGSGIRFARFAGACPRWVVHDAFLTPGLIRVQLSRMRHGKIYFNVARTVRSDRGGYLAPHAVQSVSIGCEVRYARELVYSDGVDLENTDAATPVGVTCRLCEHLDCEQRVHPPLEHPVRIDENRRGVAFYAPLQGT
jgi:hypothetical protein